MNIKGLLFSLTVIVLVNASFYAPDPYPPYPGVEEEVQQGQ